MNSRTVFTGNDGETTIRLGKRITPPTGTVSRRKLNGNFLYNVLLMVLLEPVNVSV
jgi:hypothetical protein